MDLNRRLFMLAPAAALPIATAKAATAAASAPVSDDAALIARQIQELNDAITYGRAEVWARYLHDNAVFTDEEGAVSDKAAMVAQIQPLPAGISGNLSTQDFRAHRFDDIIVCTYIIDERETYHSAQLHCQYRNTVTWVSTHDGWKLISGQSLALRTDPPEFALTPAQQQDYVGVYRVSGDTTFTITRGDGGLSGQQNDARARVLKAEVLDLLFSPGRPRYRYVFMRDAHGRVDRMIERREAWDMVFMRES